MLITVGGQLFDLKTTLGVSMLISAKFNRSPVDIFENLDKATLQEMVDMLVLAAKDSMEKKQIETAIYDSWGYMQLMNVVTAFILHLLFPGTPDEQSQQIDGCEMYNEETKNAMRARLGLPVKKILAETGTGSESSEPGTP